MLYPHAHSLANWSTYQKEHHQLLAFMHTLYDTQKNSMIVKWENPTSWYLGGVHGTEIDVKLILFSEEAQLASSQRICRLSESSMLIHNISLHDFKVGIWCVKRANAITGIILLSKTIIHTSLLHTFWHNFLDTSTVMRKCLPFNRKAVQKYFMGCSECFWWQDNKHMTLASFTKSEAMPSISYLWGMLKDCVL